MPAQTTIDHGPSYDDGFSAGLRAWNPYPGKRTSVRLYLQGYAAGAAERARIVREREEQARNAADAKYAAWESGR